MRKDRKGVDEDIRTMLERFPVLERYWNTSGAKLSGGEQQQLAIARALVSRPKLLLLDEPTLGLAPLMVDRVFEILEQLHASGTTILLVEQNAARTIEMADRTYVLRTGGRIQFHGTAEELAADRRLRNRVHRDGLADDRRSRTPRRYVQYLIDSVAYGSLFALMALSLSLLFGVMGLMNFAYGELIMVGAYTMFYTERYGWLAMVAAHVRERDRVRAADGADRVPAASARVTEHAPDHVVRALDRPAEARAT